MRPSRRHKLATAGAATASAAAESDDEEEDSNPIAQAPRAADVGASGVHVLNRFAPESSDALASATPAPHQIRPTGGSLAHGGRSAAPPVAPTPLHATHVQVRVTENFQNGRDCHVRGVKVFGPLEGPMYHIPEFESDVCLR